MSSDCEFVFKVAHMTTEIQLAMWYAQPTGDRAAIVVVRLYDAAGKRVASRSLLESEAVPKPYLFIPAQDETGLHPIGTIAVTQAVSTVKIAALTWPTLEPLSIDTFPKSYLALERSALDVAPGERVKTNIIPGRPNGSSK